ncbi:MAG: SdrD B-like domain-containing protein, partial [Planctomycetia bacterium]
VGGAGAADDLSFTTVSTNPGGLSPNYLFSFLPAGNFGVSVSGTGGSGGVPLNMSLTDSVNNGALDPAATVSTTLTTGQNRTDMDFGYQGNASLGDYVYYDVNGDGVQDANEPPIPGATVTATWFGANGAFGGGDDVVFTTTTDANGLYTFPGIPANALVGSTPNYRVDSTAPASFPTLTDSINNGVLSATDPVDVQVSPINGNPLNDRVDVDFGYRGTAQLGNFVWHDLNGNGRQDGGGEVGIDGVPVDLFFDRNNDGDFLDAGENVALASTTTMGGGAYSFTNLAAGNYQVVFGATGMFVRTVRDSSVATDATDSDGDPTTGRTGTYALANGANNQTVDQGLYIPLSLGDRVWYDLNNDGDDEAGAEIGVPGVTVNATWLGTDGLPGGVGDAADVLFTTTTGANGEWTIANLPPGEYTVALAGGPDILVQTFELDEGFSPTSTFTTPFVTPVTATSGNDRVDVDFGVRGTGSVGDRVFLDVNANGVFDAGEGIADVTVTLVGDLDGNGTVEGDETLTTTTDADGFYQFPNLRTTAAGVPYTVTVVTSTLPQDGAGNPIANTVDPDTVGAGNNTSSVTLVGPGATNQAQDFGYRGPGRIGDTIFLDVDGDNAFDAGEGITGVTVRLTGDVDADGIDETYFATTNAAGVYDFSNLPVFDRDGALITWTVTVDPLGTTLPAGVTNTVDPDGGNDGTSSLTLVAANPIDLNEDFGYRGVGSIGDRVFLDLNGDGVWNPGEGITGVDVTLTADVNGDGVAESFTTTTDADGFYQFGNLPIFQNGGVTPVSYTATIDTADLPAGVTNTIDPDGGTIDSWTGDLVADPTLDNVDFGYVGTGSLGDRVWIDADADGVQDSLALEPGLPNVGVMLIFAGQDGLFGGPDDLTTTVVTAQDGTYTFGNLAPGNYRVSVATGGGAQQVPGNMTQTFDLDGVNTAHNATRPLADGENATDVDFGYVGNASLGDRVYIDQDVDGFQDPSEPGIPGATIQLTWSGPNGTLGDADDVVFTTTTNSTGNYVFNGLPVYGAPDDYQVEVVGLPIAGLNLTDSLDDGVDGGTPSPINPIVVQVSGTNGDPLNDRRDVDFGYDGLSTLEGTVYRDDNNNGVQDMGEPGIAGVTIT